MTSLLSVIALGFFLGMRHATDPDHVVAVTTIVTRQRTVKHAALIGALWGAGHTMTIVAVGGAILLFGWVIPARVGLSMEFSVAAMLILLGIMNLAGFLEWLNRRFSSGPEETHNHRQATEGMGSGHLHEVDGAHVPMNWFDRHLGRMSLYQMVRPLLVGIVHGLAGSAAVALLVLATIRDPRWAFLYLLVFGVGTIAGMMAITAAIGWPLVYAGKSSPRLGSVLRISSGLLSLAFGLLLAYQIGFGSGLFGGHPNWTPH
jgi:high-affinity nickel-transport protein